MLCTGILLTHILILITLKSEANTYNIYTICVRNRSVCLTSYQFKHFEACNLVDDDVLKGEIVIVTNVIMT